MITLPWWNRIWTVQEALLPGRATVYWGPYELNWTVFHKAADAFFDGSAPQVPNEFWDNGCLLNLQSAMRGLSFSQGEALFEVLWRWRYRQATDPRDKVFGILGFRKDTTLPNVRTCDYTISAQALYQQVTADLIRQCRDLSPLIGRGGERSDIAGLASWAVDWHGVSEPAKRSTSNFWDHHRQWHYMGYTADHGLCGIGQGLRMFDQNTLCLTGLHVDRIAVVQHPDAEGGLPQGDSAACIFSAHGHSWGTMITELQKVCPGSLGENWMCGLLGVLTGRLNNDNPDDGDDLERWTQQIIQPQALFITSSGKFGVGPRDVQPGQEVWIVGGSRIPLILKPQPSCISETGCKDFTLLGECFVYGIMKGEAVVGREKQAHEIRLH